MRSVIGLCMLAVVTVVLPHSASAQAPEHNVESDRSVKISGMIRSVTVYQGQALVTREVDLADRTGLWEVIITGLPEHVMPASLHAEPIDGAEIRSVRYRVRPVQEDVRDEVRQLDEEIRKLQANIQEVQSRQNVLQQRIQYLDKLEGFTATTSQKELSEGVLDAATLTELSEYLFTQRETVAKEQLDAAQRLQDLNEQLQVLQRRRSVIAGSSAKTVREAVVFANIPKDAAGKLRLRYLVSQASWTPSYVLRASLEQSHVQVGYYASVQQMSGEDWPDVEMTLSTATPSLVAKAPALEPLAISLARPAPPQQAAQPAQGQADYDSEKAKLSQQRRELVEQRNRAQLFDNYAANGPATGTPMKGSRQQEAGAAGSGYFLPAEGFAEAQRQQDFALNSLASKLQLLDLEQQGRTERSAEADATTTEGVSVNYHLENRTSLPSRADRQLIQIASTTLDGDIYRLAIPVLTTYVYREAHLVNDSDLVLLAGPASTFVGDQFVGRGEIPTVAVGQSLTVGLGIDASLQVERALVERNEQIQGGNRVIELTYELIVDNFGRQPAEVRLLDRLPTADKSAVQVTLVSSTKPVSDDSQYQSSRKEEGILRWDVTVPAQAVGTDRLRVGYTMKLEHDKQLAIAEQSTTLGR